MRRSLWLSSSCLLFLAVPSVARHVRGEAIALRAPSASPGPREQPSVDSTASACVGGVLTRAGCLLAPHCGPTEIRLEGVCVTTQREASIELAMEMVTNAHVEKDGRLVTYEHVPRRPDLPSAYNRYEYPVPPWHGHTVGSGYDLDAPDGLQRRGAELAAVGHGGVDLAHDRGTPVSVVDLRNQVGDADVVYVGTLFGTTVLLRHVVRDGETLRTYLALHGHLEAPAPGIVRGMHVPAGTVIGFVGDTGAPGLVHLHYEVRLVRPKIDPMTVEPPTLLIGQNHSVPCDPRNVLPFRTTPISP